MPKLEEDAKVTGLAMAQADQDQLAHNVGWIYRSLHNAVHGLKEAKKYADEVESHKTRTMAMSGWPDEDKKKAEDSIKQIMEMIKPLDDMIDPLLEKTEDLAEKTVLGFKTAIENAETLHGKPRPKQPRGIGRAVAESILNDIRALTEWN